MKPAIISLLLSIIASILCGCESETNRWPEIAKADVDYIKKMVEENHPGYVDPDNPQFKSQLNQSYQHAIGQLKYVASLDAVMNLTNEFVASFADDHFVVGFRFARNYKVWAGIKIERRHGQYRVTRLADNWPVALPALGAQLISCDGRLADDIMREDILRYRFANYTDEFPRVMFASKLLIDDGVGFRKNPIECVFRDQSNNEISLPIKWQDSGDLNAKWDTSRYSNSESFYIEPIGPSLLWVRVPSFSFITESADLKKLRDIVASLTNMNLTADKTIVFDVRGNGGGSSIYGHQLLEAAVGKDNYWALLANNSLLDNGAVKASKNVLWRTSQDNLDQIKTLVHRIYADPAEILLVNELAAAMEQNLNQHILFTVQPKIKLKGMPEDINDTKEITSLPRIGLVTDHFCASACLDFVMAASALPNFFHVGEQTYADTQYNQPLHFTEPIELPSKLGYFYYPSKIAGQRGPFTPSVSFDGDMSDTNALKNWVMKLPVMNMAH